ncbi:general transcription factor II-I repeat domain-containing protein 2-like [Scomber scombrus]|uniref:General transcription factor II-I repeat domain-containing protein 2-like n=1 Tax=Scomber scombrus TaxID=13677 RepID=A0AAV1PW34_SCOSC
MRELESEFRRFGGMTMYGAMFSFLIKPGSFDGHDLDVSLIDWMDKQDMEIQLIELKSSTLWVFVCLQTPKSRNHSSLSRGDRGVKRNGNGKFKKNNIYFEMDIKWTETSALKQILRSFTNRMRRRRKQ